MSILPAHFYYSSAAQNEGVLCGDECKSVHCSGQLIAQPNGQRWHTWCSGDSTGNHHHSFPWSMADPMTWPFPKVGAPNAPLGPTSRRVLPPGEYDRRAMSPFAYLLWPLAVNVVINIQPHKQTCLTADYLLRCLLNMSSLSRQLHYCYCWQFNAIDFLGHSANVCILHTLVILQVQSLKDVGIACDKMIHFSEQFYNNVCSFVLLILY